MPGDLRRRVERLEQTKGASDGQTFRIFVPPSDCPDFTSWKAEGLAQAERDGMSNVIVVQFVRPGDVPPGGVLH